MSDTEFEGGDSAIPLLQRVQSRLGYLPPEAIRQIAETLWLSESEIYGVATFYSEFKLHRPGRHQIKICMGTSCYLRGGGVLLEHVGGRLGLLPGQGSSDGEFSLETVACLGCCSRSPVMSADGVIHGDLSPARADEVLDHLKQAHGDEDRL